MHAVHDRFFNHQRLMIKLVAQERSEEHGCGQKVVCAVQALIRRKVKVADPDAIYRIQVPLPLPLSWGRSVRPYVPR